MGTKRLLLILSLLFAGAGQALASAGVTYHGRLMKPDGTPVTSSSVTFRLQIRTPGNENCLMYEEQQVKDLSQSGGVFALVINDGTATVVNTEPFTLDRIFQNRGTFSFGGGKCGGALTYTPGVTDGRRLAVDFNDGTFAGWESVPTQSINYVPMAIESMTVGGYNASSLMRVVDGSGAPAVVSPFTQTQHNALLDLANGAGSIAGSQIPAGAVTDAKIDTVSGSKVTGNISGNAAGFTGSLAGDVTGSQSATTVTKIQGRAVDTAAPTNGQALVWSTGNSRWEPATISGGGSADWSTLTGKPSTFPSDWSTLANIPASFAPSPHTHAVDEITSAGGKYFTYAPNGAACTAGEVLKWNNSRWECGTDLTAGGGGITALGGDVSTTGSGSLTVTVEKIKGSAVSATAPTDGKFLKYIGSATNAWTPSDIKFSDLKNNSGLTAFNTSACAADQTVKWSSLTDMFECMSIAITESNITGNIASSKISGLGALASKGAVDVTTADVTGVVPVSKGGTGTSNGSITGTGALALAAGGTNQNVTLTPSGTGSTILGGNVGIGTATPTDALYVYRSQDAGTYVNVVNPNAGSNAVAGFNAQTNTGSVGIGANNAISWLWDEAARPLLIANNGTPRIVVAGNGHVSVGTDPSNTWGMGEFSVTGPDTNGISIANTSSTGARWPGLSIYNYGNTAGAPILSATQSRGSFASPAPVLTNDGLLSILASGQYDSTAWHAGQAASIDFVAEGNFSAAQYPSGIGFSTTSVGSTARVERVRIGNDGRVGIGTAAPQGALEVNSTTSTFLPPRMTTAQRNAVTSPAQGSVIYNTSIGKLQTYEGGWRTLGGFGGSIRYPYDTDCYWYRNSAAYGNYAANNNCSNPILTGDASAPSTPKTPGLRFAYLPAGTYMVTLSNTVAAGYDMKGCIWTFSDGTNRGGTLQLEAPSAGNTLYATGLMGQFTYATDQTNIEFRVQSRVWYDVGSSQPEPGCYLDGGQWNSWTGVQDSNLTITVQRLY